MAKISDECIIGLDTMKMFIVPRSHFSGVRSGMILWG